MRRDPNEQFAKLGAAQRRTEEIYICLRDRICLLHYPPGTKLSESQLAKEFEVSRTPIRRALLRLELEHLAERRQGLQTVVTSFDFESVRDVYAIRMILEANLASLSPAEHWWERAEQLRDIRERCRGLREHHDVARLGELHLRLQEAHADIIVNIRAREIVMQLYFQIARIWLSMVPRMNWEEEIDALIREIDDSLDAMHKRDIRALGQVRKEAIEQNIERMKAIMEHN
ncbi:GntR family transcriptional regulator [Litchfieldella rifensis]|uniref:GntR family transcriptional regulator n=1 Tax=Litchfieldella rifensis TaxID=762643 RepID=A0ABV7LUJ4_9GAMM